MESKFKANNPAGIEFTMEITMTMREWEELGKQLVNSHPSWTLSNRIDSLVAQAKKTFYPNVTAHTSLVATEDKS